MKFVFLIGDSAVGKMTVGQELTKITDLKLFHNHMMIEPVLEIFDKFDIYTIMMLRDVIFESFAYSDNYGMIFTMMWNFDNPENLEYIKHIMQIFQLANNDTEFYFVELDASQEVRLKRNKTENRLKHKPSKRDIEKSEYRLIEDDKKGRFISYENEIPFDNFIRINNDDLSAEEVALIIKNKIE